MGTVSRRERKRIAPVKLKFKGLLMDFDGTIVDSRATYLYALKNAFQRLSRSVFDTSLVTEIPKRLEQGKDVSDLIADLDSKEFLSVYLKTFYESTKKKSKLLFGAEKTLRKLSVKAKLGLVTMRCIPAEQVIAELKMLGIADCFAHVLTALDTRNPKPSPEALIKCANELHLDLCECAVVGDSVVDIEAGKKAGVYTIAVLTGIYDRKELESEKPDLILDSIVDLLDFLE